MTSEVTQLALTQLWQVTLLIVVVGGVNRWLSNHRPHLAHLLWLVVLVKCVTPPVWYKHGWRLLLDAARPTAIAGSDGRRPRSGSYGGCFRFRMGSPDGPGPGRGTTGAGASEFR